jgi:hypothetical protein
MPAGRHFNSVDLVILLVVILGVGLYIAKKLHHQGSSTALTPVVVTFQSPASPDYRQDLRLLVAGAAVRAVHGGVTYPFGTLARATAVPELIAVPTPKGRLRPTRLPFLRAIVLTIQASAGESPGGPFLFDNNPIYIGQSLDLHVGSLRLPGTVEAITARAP